MTAAVTIERVRTRQQGRAFLRVPYRIYDGDPNWVPLPPCFDAPALRRNRHNGFADGDVEFFLARRGSNPVGRIAAIRNDRHLKHFDDRTGFFGFFESTPEPAVVGALLDASSDWLRKRGLRHMVGPLNFSMHGQFATLTEGFDSRPVFMGSYNPDYYPHLLDQHGLSAAKDLLGFEASKGVQQFPARWVDAIQSLKARESITTRRFSRRNWRADAVLLRDLYTACFSGYWYFLPPTDAEVRTWTFGLMSLADAELVRFAFVDGKPAGLILAVPDWNEALVRLRPRWSATAWCRAIRTWPRIRKVRVLAIGVLPAYRWHGVDAVLCHDLFQVATARGYTSVEMSRVLADNRPVASALTKAGAQITKRYRLYTCSL